MRDCNAHDGRQALDAVAAHRPELVLLDLDLPGLGGFEICAHLKQDPATRHIPVQMLTLDEDRQHGLSRGAFTFLTKPTTTEGLNEAFDKIKNYSAPRRKKLLIVEDNPAEQLSVKELLDHEDIEVEVWRNEFLLGEEAPDLIGRSARVGRLAASQGAKQVATKMTNVARSDEGRRRLTLSIAPA